MELLRITFWIAIWLVLYAYVLYPMIVWVIFLLKFKQDKDTNNQTAVLPSVTLLVAAYNEADCLEEKLINSIAIDYPADQLQIWVVTDGSTDESVSIVGKFSRIQLFHQTERRGKIQAIQRVMELVQTELVVFSDANALLNRDSLRMLAAAFANTSVGAVAGEKRVVDGSNEFTGESVYWQYESLIKKWEGVLYSVTGPAGEIYAVRKELFKPVPEDTLSDDLHISWRIIAQGFRMVYVADAYSTEQSLPNIRQSFSRRVRVAAGSVQALMRLMWYADDHWKPVFWWEVISHRLLRTLVVPYLILLIGCLNVWLINAGDLYVILLAIQTYGYLATWFYWVKSASQKQPVWISLPAFFILVHIAMIIGAWSLWLGKQTVLWKTYPRNRDK